VYVVGAWFLLTEDMVLKKRKKFHFFPEKNCDGTQTNIFGKMCVNRSTKQHLFVG
jgi:hypothetical protein